MGRKKRVDKNQPQVVAELRGLGFEVLLSHRQGDGFPDFVAVWNGFPVFVELKSEGGRLSPAEKKFHEKTQLKIYVCFSTKEVVRAAADFMLGFGLGDGGLPEEFPQFFEEG